MAELTISAADIEGAIEDYVSSFSADTEREEIGTVVDAGDGIAHVEGLPSVMTQELLEFRAVCWVWRSTSTSTASAP
ncbi:F0F1 ATP synthase subunit alpha [Mycolicibacterium fortuitum]|uniref:F0F1 ATP synthase subunit alpha n=1 Tax=Mycolicibacterium fortuitum TaxID=1766 RepID=A0A378UTP8_MYCFO|nr:F0F1 ATP synthase subunit alpha [Mycolicibacterium fortuitum]